MTTKVFAYVVLGLDSDRKPHAARFAEADRDSAKKAAGLMGMRFGAVQGDKAAAVAKSLPEGKIFESGKGLVPLVKRGVYDQIEPLLTFDVADQAVANVVAKVKAAISDPWAAIKVTSTVLAHDKGKGWWECVVVEVSNDGATLGLRWREWPSLPKFKLPRHDVAVIAAKL